MIVHIPSSFGELVDKISVLNIKIAKLTDPEKLANVRNELKILTDLLDGFGGRSSNPELDEVNLQIWDSIDYLSRCIKNGEDCSGPAQEIYFGNIKRAKLKKAIDVAFGSEITEEKLYGHN